MFSPNSKYFNQLVSHKLIVSLGLISYPLYLVHWPILSLWALTHLEPPSTTYSLALILLSVGIATMIYLLIERPMRKLNLKRMAIWLVFMLMIIGYVGYNAYSRDGLPFRPVVENELLKNIENYLSPSDDSSDCRITLDGSAPCINVSSKRPKVFFWGDSTTANIVYGLTKKNIEDLAIQPAAMYRGACPPILNYNPKTDSQCEKFIAKTLDQISQTQPDVLVIVASWGSYLYTSEFTKLKTEKISQTIEHLKNALPVKLVVVGQFPAFRTDQVRLGAREFIPHSRTHSSRQLIEWIRDADQEIKKMAARHQITFISPLDILCNQNGCMLSASSDSFVPMAYDAIHMTYPGAKLFFDLAFSKNTFHETTD